MHRTVVIDGNEYVIARAAQLFRDSGYDVQTARTGERGIALLTEYQPHAVLVNLILPDMSGLDVVRAVRRARPTSCTVVTGVARCRHAVRAMRCGADDCTEQPADSRMLLRTVRTILSKVSEDAPVDESIVAHSLQRWVEVVVSSTRSPADLRTLREWGRFVGVSVGGLRNWCRAANLPARRSLLFARVLRAVVRQRGTDLTPDCLLNIVDRRSLGKLMLLGGGTRQRLPPSVEDFLQRQQLICEPKALATLRGALSATGKGCAS